MPGSRFTGLVRGRPNFAASFCSSLFVWCLTVVAKKLAIRAGLVAQPAEDRYHQTVIPLGGGIAIFSTISIIILTAITVVKFLAVPGHFDWLGQSVTIHTDGEKFYYRNSRKYDN